MSAYVWNTFVALVCHFAAWGLGAALRRLAGALPDPRGRENFLSAFFSAVVGLSMFGLWAFGLAAIGRLVPWLLWWSVFMGACCGVWVLWNNPPRWRWTARRDDVPLYIALMFFAWRFADALLPVLDDDDTVYHMVLPRKYLEASGFVDIDLLFARMPHFVEMLYTIPMALGDFTAPKIFTYFCNAWVVLGLLGALYGHLGRLGSNICVLLYMSSPAIIWHMGRAYVEPVMGVFLLCAVIALRRWWRDTRWNDLILFGLACGVVAASKYQGFIFSSALLAMFLLSVALQPDAWRRKTYVALVPLGIVAVFVVPWMIRAAWLTGSPLYPALCGHLGGCGFSQIELMQLSRAQAKFGGERSIIHFLALPLRLVFDLANLEAVLAATYVVVLWAACCAPGAFRRREARYLWAAALISFLGWAFSMRVARYLVPWIGTWILMAGVALSMLRRRRRLLWAFVCVTTLEALLHQAFATNFEKYIAVNNRGMDIFLRPRDAIISRNLKYALSMFLNHEVPPNGRVLAMWESRLFFLDRGLIGDALYEAPHALGLLRSAGSAEKFAGWLRANGITHVVINVGAGDHYFAPQTHFAPLDKRIYPASQLGRDHTLLIEFMTKYLQPIKKIDVDLVCRVKP